MKKLLPSSLLLLSLLAGTAFAQQKPDKPGVALTFEDAAVMASGLTPGGAVIWFGVEHRIDAEYSGEMAQRYQVGTAAADGTARLDLGRSIAPRSFWVAVDLGSGDFLVAAPGGYRI